jgi:hypothetical protein
LLTIPLAVYSTLVGMTMSSRAKDVRVAEHLSGLVLLPSALPFLLVTARIIPPAPLTWFAMLGVILALNGALSLIIRRVFDRERLVATV